MEMKEIGLRDWGVKEVTLCIARGRQVDYATHHRSRLLVLRDLAVWVTTLDGFLQNDDLDDVRTFASHHQGQRCPESGNKNIDCNS